MDGRYFNNSGYFRENKRTQNSCCNDVKHIIISS